MNSNLSEDILKEILLKDGRKLILRKPTEEDADDVINYLNIVGGESDNLLFGKNEITFTKEQEVSFIENINSNPNALMVLGVVDNEIVSVAQINSSPRKRIAHNSEIAISVKKDYWSMGIGSAVIEELLKFAKEHEAKNVSLGVKADNYKAIKLYEKFGFERVGLHKNYFNINGTYADEVLMDLYI